MFRTHAVNQQKALLLLRATACRALRVIPGVVGTMGRYRAPEKIPGIKPDAPVHSLLSVSVHCGQIAQEGLFTIKG